MAWGAWLAWLGVIFCLSSQSSLGDKIRAGQLAADLLAKLAHVIEYGVLALLTMNALARVGANGQRAARKAAVWAILFAALYGASDEWHQSFVPGREARITDVMIDAAGAAAGVWLAAARSTFNFQSSTRVAGQKLQVEGGKVEGEKS